MSDGDTSFNDLLTEALDLGIEDVAFGVDLRGFPGYTDCLHQRWSAKAASVTIPHLARGYTMEEALQELVTFVRLFQEGMKNEAQDR